MQAQRLPDDLDHALARVQRRERILEDHLHLAAERRELAPPGVGDVVATEADAALGGVDQAHDRA